MVTGILDNNTQISFDARSLGSRACFIFSAFVLEDYKLHKTSQNASWMTSRNNATLYITYLQCQLLSITSGFWAYFEQAMKWLRHIGYLQMMTA